MGNKNSATFSTDSSSTMPQAYKGAKSNFKRTGSLPSRLNHAKHNSLIDFENTAKFLYMRCETFSGLKNDEIYRQIQTEVAEASKELQEYRNKLRKSDKLAADDIQRTLSSCVFILVKKAQDNEHVVLDHGAVESESFIAQNVDVKSESGVSEVVLRKAPKKEEPKLKKEPKQEEEKIKDSPKPIKQNRKSAYAPGSKYHRRMQPLHEIEREVRDLKAEIDETILLQNTDKFESQEKRIKSICIQLELIKVESYTPLSEKKSELYETMIKCNKTIKRARRKLLRQSVADTPETSTSKRELEAIEKKISEAEKQLEKEEAVSSVKDKMKELQSKLNNMRDSNTTKDRKQAALKKIKNILNDIQILDVEKRLSKLQMMVLNFSDTKGSSQYLILDQLLRQLWDEVSELDVLTYKKQMFINSIQEALKLLVKNCKEPEENKEIVYENKNIVKQHPQSQAVSPIKISKPPLPSPRDAVGNNVENSLIQQLQLLDDVSNWNSVSEREAAMIKNKLTNIMSKIDEALDGLPKNSEHHDPEAQNEQNASLGTDAANDTLEQPKEQTDIIVNTVTSSVSMHRKYGSLDALEANENPANANTFEPIKKVSSSADLKENQKGVEGIQPAQVENSAIHFNFAQKNANISSASRISNLPTLSQLTDQMSSIQSNVEDLGNQVQAFVGIYKDNIYEKIHNGLNHCLEELNSIDSVEYTTVETSKSKLLQQILTNLDELNTKVLQNQVTYKATKAEVKEVAERLSNIKKKIDGFTGAYKNVLYVQIESELLKCLDKLHNLYFPGDAKLQHAIAQTKQKNEQFLKILEEKSTKSYTTDSSEPVQSNDSTPDAAEAKTPSDEVQRLRKRLLKVRNDAESFSGTSEDPMYALIQNDLWKCSEELKQMQDLGRQSVIDSKKQYLDYVEQLQIYLEQKAEQAAYYTK